MTSAKVAQWFGSQKQVLAFVLYLCFGGKVGK
jgi:hypothetical protein